MFTFVNHGNLSNHRYETYPSLDDDIVSVALHIQITLYAHTDRHIIVNDYSGVTPHWNIVVLVAHIEVPNYSINMNFQE